MLDADLAGDFAGTTLSGDDYQVGLSAGHDRASVEAFVWFPGPRRGPPAGLRLAARPDGSQGYALEAAVPWALFGAAPTGGGHFGFGLSASDNDAPGTAQQQSMISTEAGRRLTNPTTWGTLILDP